MRNVPSLETIHRDYSTKGVQFFYVYKQLAHPETGGYIDPIKIEERLKHARLARQKLGSEFKWLCDNMQNEFSRAMGRAPNSEFVVDPNGKVVRKRSWSRPTILRRDLEQLVGPARKVTKVKDLKIKPRPAASQAAKGIVPRIHLPSGMVGLKSVPLTDRADSEFFVKLRAEGDRKLRRTRTGKLYLAFHLDPIYKVHWNNQLAPISYELKLPEGMTADKPSGSGPKVDEPADSDPREFVIEISGDRQSEQPIEVTVKYFACDDAETFCLPLTQHYQVYLKADRELGWRMRTGPNVGAAMGLK